MPSYSPTLGDSVTINEGSIDGQLVGILTWVGSQTWYYIRYKDSDGVSQVGQFSAAEFGPEAV